MKNAFLSTIFILTIGVFITPYLSAQEKTEVGANEFFEAVKYRSIGPFRGGRSVSSHGVVGDPLTYYMGTTGGGVWKTADAGQHWYNISDGFFKLGSVGAIAVSTSDPNVIYVGMGEHAPRGVMTSHGDGVYKSTDAGKTWTNVGLIASQHISRIRIHPKNPDVVYVAAQGALYGPNEERGIFKTTDGGKTWKKVLYVNDLTGCSELDMDLSNPNILYATMWEHQRKPWIVISGGSGSGVYKSTDAGETWFKIEKGLPEEKGKMAISIAQSNPEKVYALVESDTNLDKGGLFVSNNGGSSWSMVSGDNRLTQRAWYYIEVFADPNDENTVYVLSAPNLRSIDGGKNWEVLSGTHGDYHDLWINPDNSNNLCISNDGGAAISFNFGETWSTQANMPTAQFYRINTDNGFPYRIYAGQQDNSSVSIEHRALGSYGIGVRNWDASAGGESAFLAFDPDNPRFVMGGSYLGTIEILDNRANAGTNIMAAPIQYIGREARDMKYRYNWNAPIIWSQHEPNTFYHAAQLLLRTRDFGQSWEEVSPDLSRNDDSKQGNGGGPYTNEAVGAENYGTISYVMESPHAKGELWVCTDDGYVQLTRNGGEKWENVTPKGLEECLVNAIDISPHQPGTAFIATTRYKFNDHRPGLYMTENYGKSWTNITGNIPVGSYTRVVRQDTENPNLLFAGTETGIFVSFDKGKNWESIQLNLPVTPVLDLKIAHDDLIVATSGRSFWIMDDLELVRQHENKKEEGHLFEPAKAILTNGGSELNGNSASFKGSNPLQGVNPANGVVIYYQLPEIPDSIDAVMEIRDENGKLVRTLYSKADKDFISYDGGPPSPATISKHKGLNRFVWDMRTETMPGIPKAYIEGSYRGHKVPPGNYKINVKAGDKTWETKAEILENPLYTLTKEDYLEYDAFMTAAEANLADMHNMVNEVMNSKLELEAVLEKISTDAKYDVLRKEIKTILKEITIWDEDMVQRKSKAYDDVENFPNKFTANYIFAINSTESDIPKVNEPSKERIKELNTEWEDLRKTGSMIISEKVPVLNKALWDAGVGALSLGSGSRS